MEFKGTHGDLTLHEESFLNSSTGFYIQSVASKLENNMLFANAYGHTKEEAEANAKLIVCAPELLERLVELNAFCTMSKKDREENEALIKKATTI